MSADNYFVVRRNGDGFSALMGFASDGYLPVPTPCDPTSATVEAAFARVSDEYAEYGHGIHSECEGPREHFSDPDELGAAVREGSMQARMRVHDHLAAAAALLLLPAERGWGCVNSTDPAVRAVVDYRDDLASYGVRGDDVVVSVRDGESRADLVPASVQVPLRAVLDADLTWARALAERAGLSLD